MGRSENGALKEFGSCVGHFEISSADDGVAGSKARRS
jgi:hypothetical protein